MTRASDAEREATVRRLHRAAGEGRLTVEELDGRLDAAYAAATRAELEPLTADLPEETALAPLVEPGDGGSSLLFGIFGGSDRTGRWRVPRRMTVINVFGGADLDLREATLSAREVQITVLSLFGGSDIIVPEGMRVDLSSFAIFGGDDMDLKGPEPPLGAPVVRVRTVSIFSGTDIESARRS